MLWHVSWLRGQTKGNNNGYSQLTCLVHSMKRDNMKLPPSVIDRRGGVLESTFWSPWPQRSQPWPQSLQVLENALSSVEDSTTFWVVKNGLRSWPFSSSPEILRKICKKTFSFQYSGNTCALCPWSSASNLVSSTPALPFVASSDKMLYDN